MLGHAETRHWHSLRGRGIRVSLNVGRQANWGKGREMLKTRSSTLVFGLAYVVLVVGVFLALGGAAYAADENPTSASDQYGSKVEDVAQALPTTGLSLLATALIGGALLAVGVALRRRERRGKA